jgi:hypothetical protein
MSHHASHAHTPEVHESADAWHHHESNEPEPQHEHAATLNTRMLAVGFVALTLTIAFLVLALVLFFNAMTTTRIAREREGTQNSEPYLTYRASAERVLGINGESGEFNWASPPGEQAQPMIQIPIDVAAQKVIQRYQSAQR